MNNRNFLRRWRGNRGLSQEDMALRTGMSQSAYSRFERDNDPRIGNVIAVANVVDIELCELAKRMGYTGKTAHNSSTSRKVTK